MPALSLFVNKSGREWNRKHWGEKFREAAHKAGVPKGTVPTWLRHSTITDWVNAGMTPGDVARTVGTSVVMIELNYYQGRDTTAIREAISVI